jgi:hypothetical protein
MAKAKRKSKAVVFDLKADDLTAGRPKIGIEVPHAPTLGVHSTPTPRVKPKRTPAQGRIVKVFPDGFGAWRNQTHAQTKILQKLNTPGEAEIKRRTFMHACEDLGPPWWPI